MASFADKPSPIFPLIISNSSPEPFPVSRLDEVDESLHHDIRLALTVLNVQQEFVAWQDVRVSVDVVHGHDCHRAQFRS